MVGCEKENYEAVKEVLLGMGKTCSTVAAQAREKSPKFATTSS